MSLVWHIVRKDLRRLWLPLGLWLGLWLAQTVLLAGDAGGNQASPAAFDGWRYFTGMWGLIVLGTGFVLAAWLVMEDSLVSGQAFWPTRPISGLRLLAAKGLGAFLMFGLGPVLALSPIWLACAFSLQELGSAARQVVATQGIATLAAFALASVTATSGQFLTRAVGAAILVPLTIKFALGELFHSDAAITTGVIVSRAWLVSAVLLATPPVVILHQYLTRRTARSWVLGWAGLGLMLAVRFGWFCDISALIQTETIRAGDEATELRSVTLTGVHAGFDRDLSQPERQRVMLEGAMDGIPPASYLRLDPSLGEWLTGAGRLPLNTRLRAPVEARQPPGRLVRQLAGLPDTESGPRSWMIEGTEMTGRIETARTAGHILAATLNLTLMRGRVIGELPLRVGAELRSGACRTRVIGLERREGRVFVRLADRDACPELQPDDKPMGMVQSPARPAVDSFVLLRRSRATGQIAALHEIGTVRVNSIIVGQRELALEPPTREVNGRTVELPDWEEEAVIVQVRFCPVRTFIRPLQANPFAP